MRRRAYPDLYLWTALVLLRKDENNLFRTCRLHRSSSLMSLSFSPFSPVLATETCTCASSSTSFVLSLRLTHGSLIVSGAGKGVRRTNWAASARDRAESLSPLLVLTVTRQVCRMADAAQLQQLFATRHEKGCASLMLACDANIGRVVLSRRKSLIQGCCRGEVTK
jgi:hypothetical protein